MANDISFDDLRKAMLFHRIVEWKDNYIRLDNGMELRIEETDFDCCASAWGQFEDVKLDAAITAISDIQYEHWDNGDTYGCSAVVTIMHNRNIICKSICDANARNVGYFYSIASFCVKMPNGHNRKCHFVVSDDE